MSKLRAALFSGVLLTALPSLAQDDGATGRVPDPAAIPGDPQDASLQQPQPVQELATTPSHTLITFNEYPVNTVITEQYKASGVVFDKAYIELDNLPNPSYLSGSNEYYPSPYGDGKNATPITATFLTPTNQVSADPIYLDAGATMTLEVFDKNGASIGKTIGTSRLKIEAKGIAKAVFTFSDAGGRIDDIAGIDNLDFTPKPVIVLDPGHGLLLGTDKRKHYQRPESPNFLLREDNLTLSIAASALQQLIADKYVAYQTRSGADALYGAPCGAPDPETDTISHCNEDLKRRIAVVSKLKAQDKDVVFVSIHTNGGNARLLNGRTQTFYCMDDAAPLADKLLKQIWTVAPANLSLRTGGYKECSQAVVVRTAELGMPGSLVEVLYHTDSDDEALLNSAAFRDQAGKRIAKAIEDFIENNLNK